MNPRKVDPRTVLLLGSGAIRIGQAGEFDYSGTQAIKALKEMAVRVVLINPNIATIQTSEGLADRVYFLPLEAAFVESVIARERPDGILLGFGGQTALNVGLELEEKGVLARYGVEVWGTPLAAIRKTEDRELFVRELDEIGCLTPRSRAVVSLDEALAAAQEIGFPVMCRGAFALGGLGSGVAHTVEELRALAGKALGLTPQVLVEEYLGGWKELEYEVVRDRCDNCIVVCSMENVDPMGIHTGESIVVAPVQTLSAAENFRLRSIAIRVIRHLGIVGECNIQFALHPHSDEYRIIEVNARLSRSSALASKATGYPLAWIAARLALGDPLTAVTNRVTRETSACFEPALDYVVVKFPRWDMQKFHRVDCVLGSEMKSVGEVMAVDRTFEAALQKAARMLDIGLDGVVENDLELAPADRELHRPTDRRIFAVAAALADGAGVAEVYAATRIHPWFLQRIAAIVETAGRLRDAGAAATPPALLRRAKQLGFSDGQLARLWKMEAEAVRAMRQGAGIVPVVRQIDTLAGEYPARTNYLYLTYNGSEDDIAPEPADQAVVVLGGGPYRIGSSVEFDWCCVNAAEALRRLHRPTVLINCNPETVSTDFDVCDRLYFEELSVERVRDICEKERPHGVIVSMGGQIPNNLALPLHRAGVPILGTSPLDIDRAEDRRKFSQLLDELGIAQPPWQELTSLAAAERFAADVGYPVLIRPSYVLSGAAMGTARHAAELRDYLRRASRVSPEHPVVISKFITGAKEIELDGVALDGGLYVYGISEHVENAGVHSGDATLVLPPQRTYLETLRRVKRAAGSIARALRITGPCNMQFIARGNDIQVIECNLRASRSFPFVSKVLRRNFIDLAVRAMSGALLPALEWSAFDLDYVGVKAPQFSFTRLKGSDPLLGVEMASTGEVACLADDFSEALVSSLYAVGFRPLRKGVLLVVEELDARVELLPAVQLLQRDGIPLCADEDTAGFYAGHGLTVRPLKRGKGRRPGDLDALLAERAVDLVIMIPGAPGRGARDDGYALRRRVVDLAVPLLTDIKLARRFIESHHRTPAPERSVKAWDEYR